MSDTTVLITAPDGQQRRLLVGSGGLRVGRAPDNDVLVRAAGVAPYHAVICLSGASRTRLASGRPGVPLVIEVPADADAGAAVRIGGYTIRLSARPNLAAA
jgi:hypothetical protein